MADPQTTIWPAQNAVLVHVLTGETYSFFERWNHSQNPHYGKVRGWTAHGDCWIQKLRLLRPAMPGERRAHANVWYLRTGWRAAA